MSEHEPNTDSSNPPPPKGEHTPNVFEHFSPRDGADRPTLDEQTAALLRRLTRGDETAMAEWVRRCQSDPEVARWAGEADKAAAAALNELSRMNDATLQPFDEPAAAAAALDTLGRNIESVKAQMREAGIDPLVQEMAHVLLDGTRRELEGAVASLSPASAEPGGPAADPEDPPSPRDSGRGPKYRVTLTGENEDVQIGSDMSQTNYFGSDKPSGTHDQPPGPRPKYDLTLSGNQGVQIGDGMSMTIDFDDRVSDNREQAINVRFTGPRSSDDASDDPAAPGEASTGPSEGTTISDKQGVQIDTGTSQKKYDVTMSGNQGVQIGSGMSQTNYIGYDRPHDRDDQPQAPDRPNDGPEPDDGASSGPRPSGPAPDDSTPTGAAAKPPTPEQVVSDTPPTRPAGASPSSPEPDDPPSRQLDGPDAGGAATWTELDALYSKADSGPGGLPDFQDLELSPVDPTAPTEPVEPSPPRQPGGLM